MKPYAFGVDIGGTAIKLGLFRADGTLLEKWQIPTRTQDKGSHVLPDMLTAVRGFMDKNDIVWTTWRVSAWASPAQWGTPASCLAA